MIEKIVKPFITPIQRKILMPLKRAKNWPKLLAKWIKRKFKEILGQKEITKASYVPIGNYYVSKKLIVIVVVVLLVLYFFIFIKPPKFVNNLLNRKPAVTAQADGTVAAYSGAAKLHTSDGTLLYEGELADGLYQGPGKLFHPQGSLDQEGTFEKGQLVQGSDYNDNGTLVYKGAFAEGMYSGQGALYRPDGTVEYQGEFQAGAPSGQGRLFGETGAIQYEGGFANGMYAGDGIEYDNNGKIRYQGQFLSGRYNGPGKLLSADGVIRYEGAFSNGQPSGEGVQYFPSGSVQYDGGFLAGAFSGQGILYAMDGTIVYIGSFLAGKFHGDGEHYGTSGAAQYQGKYMNGLLHGPGVWLRPDGTAVYKGNFLAGEPDVTAFLGLTPVRLEELLGKATGVEVLGGTLPASEAPEGEEAAPEEAPDLLMRFQELRMEFVVRLSDSGTGETGVSEIQLNAGELTDRLYTLMNTRALTEPSIGPYTTRNPRERIYQWNGTTYMFSMRGDAAAEATVRPTL